MRGRNHQDHDLLAEQYLSDLLSDAVENGAEAVELERVPEGLEVCIVIDGNGIGTVIRERELQAALIRLVLKRAAMKTRGRGKLKWKVLGLQRTIRVEQYDSFGEACFRLTFGKGS